MLNFWPTQTHNRGLRGCMHCLAGVVAHLKVNHASVSNLGSFLFGARIIF